MRTTVWIIETTLEKEDQAHTLAAQAVETGLAACAQVEKGITSHYIWKGEHERSPEIRVQFKLADKKRAEFTRWLLAHHPYTCPQILAWPVESSNPEYTRWVLGE